MANRVHTLKKMITRKLPKSLVLYFAAKKMKKDPALLTFVEYLIGISEFMGSDTKWNMKGKDH